MSAGEGLTIGIHPASPNYPPPGTRGAMLLGLDIEVGIDAATAQLFSYGVTAKGSVIRSEAGNFVYLEDPDGSDMYLWEKVGQELSTVDKAMAMSGR